MAAVSVGVYLRVSSETQRDRETIRTQRDYAERYLALHEISTALWYVDDGVSASKPVNLDELPEGARLLSDCKAGRISRVYIYKLDRLGRNARLILNAVGELEAAGAQVGSMTEPFDTVTPAGRFMLTMLAAVAQMERDTFIERSRAGSERLAREGAWLGGIVPYGYRVEGKGKDARLVVWPEEASHVRQVYQWAVEEGLSCIKIAERLNGMGVPPAYARDGREVLRGKRRERTQGIWRYGRVRNMLVNPTYKGVHRYGTRSKSGRAPIERAVPAIVSSETWERAQEVLHANFLFNPRGAKRRYLLRGLIRCGVCGLNYTGTSYRRKDSEQHYYVCNGRQNSRRGIERMGRQCPSAPIPGSIEDVVWADIEEFLRDPGKVADELMQQLDKGSRVVERLEEQGERWRRALERNIAERDKVVSLYRRGRIDEEVLERQLNEVEAVIGGLRGQIEEWERRAEEQARANQVVIGAQALLEELRARVAGGVTWEVKRDLVERLVLGIVVETGERDDGGRPEPHVTISYVFEEPPPKKV